MLSAKSFAPVSVNVSFLAFHTCCCATDEDNDLNASALPVLVSQGEIDAQRVPSKDLCLGMAQSYLERKLHITTTQSTSGLVDTALKTLRAIPEFPEPGDATQTY